MPITLLELQTPEFNIR